MAMKLGSHDGIIAIIAALLLGTQLADALTFSQKTLDLKAAANLSSEVEGGCACSMDAAEMKTGTRCSVELWDQADMSRKEAFSLCAVDKKCKGLMWYSGDGGDGKTVERGWFAGCGGYVDDYENRLWTSFVKPSGCSDPKCSFSDSPDARMSGVSPLWIVPTGPGSGGLTGAPANWYLWVLKAGSFQLAAGKCMGDDSCIGFMVRPDVGDWYGVNVAVASTDPKQTLPAEGWDWYPKPAALLDWCRIKAGTCHKDATCKVVSGQNIQCTCKTGFVGSGKTCEPAPCNGHLMKPLNAQLGTCARNLNPGEKCRMQCNLGFRTLNGREDVECFEGRMILQGQPDAKAACFGPICEEEVKPPAFGSLGDCPKKLKGGEYCTPVCQAGYHVTGVTKCESGKIVAARCADTVCDASAAPVNGHPGTCTKELFAGSTCQITCNLGFEPFGGDNGKTVCTKRGIFPAKCVPKGCRDFQVEGTGNSKPNPGSCQGRVPHGQSCYPTCGPGFVVKGSARCEMGVFKVTDGPIVCKPAPCTLPGPPVDGSWGNCPRKLKSGEGCVPKCNQGHVRVGANTSCLQGKVTEAKCEKVCSWMDAQAIRSRKCTKTLWGNEQKFSRYEAANKCDKDPECIGLQWHNVHGHDGQLTDLGWYNGCGGSYEGEKVPRWDILVRPCDWRFAQVKKRTACKAILWTEETYRNEAISMCVLDEYCDGLAFYNPGGGKDAKKTEKGKYAACSFQVAGKTDPDWDIMIKPVYK
eukprot:TRINITY_DN9753_c0_g2_i5.p1 TRINITY_DN9753_c0_g2~~TRINITY_DN9753_c0_g2_i5.p1  ORF type:complete len:774 (+),score=140.71 TRINITY_DN9753_c0_g2_i5:70-2322(+)